LAIAAERVRTIMQTSLLLADLPIPLPRHWLAGDQAWQCQSPAPQRPPALASDCDFIALLGLYRGTGGLAKLVEVAALTTRRSGLAAARPPDPTQGQALGWSWQGEWWLPMCQFQRSDMRVKAVVAQVLGELLPVLDGLALAYWWVQAHAALGDRRPVDLMDLDPAALTAAARADRFVLSG
jgi:hypothetical protein